MEDDILSGQLCTLVIIRESQVQILFLSCAHADHTVFKAIDKGVASENEIKALCGTSLKCHSVLCADIIDIGGISLSSRTSGNNGRILGLKALKLILHHKIRYLLLCSSQGQALIISQLDAGLCFACFSFVCFRFSVFSIAAAALAACHYHYCCHYCKSCFYKIFFHELFPFVF